MPASCEYFYAELLSRGSTVLPTQHNNHINQSIKTHLDNTHNKNIIKGNAVAQALC